MKNDKKQSAISNKPSAFRNKFLSLRNLIHKARLNSSLMELANEATVELDIVEQAAVTLAESLEELACLRAIEVAARKTVDTYGYYEEHKAAVEKLAAALKESENQ